MENKNTKGPDRERVRVGRLIGPLILYYIMSSVAQMIYLLGVLPRVLYEFIVSNESVQEMLGFQAQDWNKNEMYQLFPKFIATIDQDSYYDFVVLLLEKSIGDIAYITVLTGILTIPLLWNMMRRDVTYHRIMPREKLKLPLYKYLYIAVGGITLCVALNNVITLIDLAEISESYQNTSEALYSMRFRYQLLGLGIVVPVAEELLYRGVLYNRFKVNISPRNAMLLSGFIFASLHGNLVQMFYGMVAGLTFAWLYEKFNSIWAPILAHCVMNLSSVCLTRGDVFYWIFSDNMRVCVITVLCATLCSLMYVLIVGSEEGN